MRKFLIIIGLILCGVSQSYTQRPINIDSVRQVMAHLETNKPSFGNDTLKVLTLQEICVYQNGNGNADSAKYYQDKAFNLSLKINWKKGIADMYLLRLDYNNPKIAFEHINKALKIAKEIKNDKIFAAAYFQYANIYFLKANYTLAIKYYQISLKYAEKANDTFGIPNTYNLLATSYKELGDKKTALAYFKKMATYSKIHKVTLMEAFALANMGETLLDSVGHTYRAIKMIEQSNLLFKKLKRYFYLAEGEASIGQKYLERKMYNNALPYLLNGWQAYQKYHHPFGLNDDNLDKNLYETYKNLQQPAKALYHLERYNTLLDTNLRAEIKSQLDIVKVEAEKQKQQSQINNLKIKQLAQDKKLQTRTNSFLWAGLGLLSILGFGLIWYNRKLSSKNNDLAQKNELIKEVTTKIQATEIKALRAQMNPHFIFNCLNSIEFFTANNEPEKASEYLNKFSRLIRLVLENSRSEKVALDNELETLKLYMDLEAMRFKGKIDYSINIDPALDSGQIEIPPLLIQPFVENAIWHGLMHKEAGGHINIDVTENSNNILRITITDNGIGRTKAAELKSKSATKSKSFGMKVTSERIDLINQLYNTHTSILVDDLYDASGQAIGTKVVVEIPV